MFRRALWIEICLKTFLLTSHHASHFEKERQLLSKLDYP
jgi:hypothetical protein